MTSSSTLRPVERSVGMAARLFPKQALIRTRPSWCMWPSPLLTRTISSDLRGIEAAFHCHLIWPRCVRACTVSGSTRRRFRARDLRLHCCRALKAPSLWLQLVSVRGPRFLLLGCRFSLLPALRPAARSDCSVGVPRLHHHPKQYSSGSFLVSPIDAKNAPGLAARSC